MGQWCYLRTLMLLCVICPNLCTEHGPYFGGKCLLSERGGWWVSTCWVPSAGYIFASSVRLCLICTCVQHCCWKRPLATKYASLFSFLSVIVKKLSMVLLQLYHKNPSFFYFSLLEYPSCTSVSECLPADSSPLSSVFDSQLDWTVLVSNHMSAVSGILLPYTDWTLCPPLTPMLC